MKNKKSTNLDRNARCRECSSDRSTSWFKPGLDVVDLSTLGDDIIVDSLTKTAFTVVVAEVVVVVVVVVGRTV